MASIWDSIPTSTEAADAGSEWAASTFLWATTLSQAPVKHAFSFPTVMLKLQTLAMTINTSITSNFFSDPNGDLVAKCKCMFLRSPFLSVVTWICKGYRVVQFSFLLTVSGNSS